MGPWNGRRKHPSPMQATSTLGHLPLTCCVPRWQLWVALWCPTCRHRRAYLKGTDVQITVRPVKDSAGRWGRMPIGTSSYPSSQDLLMTSTASAPPRSPAEPGWDEHRAGPHEVPAEWDSLMKTRHSTPRTGLMMRASTDETWQYHLARLTGAKVTVPCGLLEGGDACLEA